MILGTAIFSSISAVCKRNSPTLSVAKNTTGWMLVNGIANAQQMGYFRHKQPQYVMLHNIDLWKALIKVTLELNRPLFYRGDNNDGRTLEY